MLLLYSPKTALTNWTSTLNIYPNNYNLWLHYVKYRHSEAAAFSVFEIINIYKECFDRLERLTNSNNRDEIERILIKLLIEMTVMLDLAGKFRFCYNVYH